MPGEIPTRAASEPKPIVRDHATSICHKVVGSLGGRVIAAASVVVFAAVVACSGLGGDCNKDCSMTASRSNM